MYKNKKIIQPTTKYQLLGVCIFPTPCHFLLKAPPFSTCSVNHSFTTPEIRIGVIL